MSFYFSLEFAFVALSLLKLTLFTNLIQTL